MRAPQIFEPPGRTTWYWSPLILSRAAGLRQRHDRGLISRRRSTACLRPVPETTRERSISTQPAAGFARSRDGFVRWRAHPCSNRLEPAPHRRWYKLTGAVRSPYRLLALDVDGTLLDPNGRLRPRTAAAVARAAEAGIRPVLCTGRRYRRARPIAV